MFPLSIKKVLVIVFLALVLLLHYFTFAFRYTWFVSNAEAVFLLGVHLVFVTLIILMWYTRRADKFVPAVVGLSLVYPGIVRTDVYVPIDLTYAALIALNMVLMWLATKSLGQIRFQRP